MGPGPWGADLLLRHTASRFQEESSGGGCFLGISGARVREKGVGIISVRLYFPLKIGSFGENVN